MSPGKMTAIIQGRRYSTESATLLCGDDWWDGHNFERGGTNQFLYRTPKGAYFFVCLTQWSGSRDRIDVCTVAEAREFFEECAQRDEARVTFEEAFPGVQVVDA